MVDFSLKSYYKINDLGAGRPGKRPGAGNGRFLIKVLLRNQRFGRRAVRRAAGGRKWSIFISSPTKKSTMQLIRISVSYESGIKTNIRHLTSYKGICNLND